MSENHTLLQLLRGLGHCAATVTRVSAYNNIFHQRRVVFLVKRFNNTAWHRLFPTDLATTGEEKAHTVYFETVLRIQIRRIRMFLGLPDPHPDPLLTNTDPNPDPSLST